MSSSTFICAVCRKKQDANTTLQQCSRCKVRVYCGSACQTSDWPAHRGTCRDPSAPPRPSSPKWYDKHRRCEDGSLHEGDLELITWPCTEEGMGWGNILAAEAADHKRKFEQEYSRNKERFFEYWPMGFRWTCCGIDAELKWGCDHHGTGSWPCKCDFCRMGGPLPDSIYYQKTASRKGLELPRGPDPRSYNGILAEQAVVTRDKYSVGTVSKNGESVLLRVMSHNDEDSFFERERDKLAREITLNFEELLSSINGLNRKLEEVLGMTKEYDTIASLWHTFYRLMSEPTPNEESDQGLPGTGGYVVSSSRK